MTGSYMENKDIFTLDPYRYPAHKMANFIRSQKAAGKHIVAIVDPGVSIKHGFKPHDLGVQAELFIRNNVNTAYYRGLAWPGAVYFVDFLCPRSLQYWRSLLFEFQRLLPYDGIWIDMNEPASMRVGDGGRYPQPPNGPQKCTANFPPYAINNAGRQEPIFIKTIDMDAIHCDGQRHLSLHNIYGLSEAFTTWEALSSISPEKRPFILSRSTFPGIGQFAAHWLGDNHSSFHDMKMSIIGIFDFQIFGIPMVGADICGFLGSAEEELCARWMALGAFYPFARNHNAEKVENISQEPYRWPIVTEVTKKYFGFRYSIISYWYSLAYLAHTNGRPMIRPLFFDYVDLDEFASEDKLFMVGDSILVAPVLDRNIREMDLVMPPGIWYDALEVDTTPIKLSTSTTIKVNTPLESIPVFIKGGSCLLKQQPQRTIGATLEQDYELICYLNSALMASGSYYFDDYESPDPEPDRTSTLEFTCDCDVKTCLITLSGTFGQEIDPVLRVITVVYPTSPSRGIPSHYFSDNTQKSLNSPFQHVLVIGAGDDGDEDDDTVHDEM